MTCHSRGRGGTNIFAKATETESWRNLESLQSVANKIPIAGVVNIFVKENRHSHNWRESVSESSRGERQFVRTRQVVLSNPKGARAL